MRVRAEFPKQGSQETVIVSLSSEYYTGAAHHLPLRLALEAINADTREELNAFASYLYLVATYEGRCDHFIPINEGLILNLTALCSQPKFASSMDLTHDVLSPPTTPATDDHGATGKDEQYTRLRNNGYDTSLLVPARPRGPQKQRSGHSLINSGSAQPSRKTQASSQLSREQATNFQTPNRTKKD